MLHLLLGGARLPAKRTGPATSLRREGSGQILPRGLHVGARSSLRCAQPWLCAGSSSTSPVDEGASSRGGTATGTGSRSGSYGESDSLMALTYPPSRAAQTGGRRRPNKSGGGTPPERRAPPGSNSPGALQSSGAGKVQAPSLGLNLYATRRPPTRDPCPWSRSVAPGCCTRGVSSARAEDHCG
jgi:hypothetical protein